MLGSYLNDLPPGLFGKVREIVRRWWYWRIKKQAVLPWRKSIPSASSMIYEQMVKLGYDAMDPPEVISFYDPTGRWAYFQEHGVPAPADYGKDE